MVAYSHPFVNKNLSLRKILFVKNYFLLLFGRVEGRIAVEVLEGHVLGLVDALPVVEVNGGGMDDDCGFGWPLGWQGVDLDCGCSHLFFIIGHGDLLLICASVITFRG